MPQNTIMDFIRAENMVRVMASWSFPVMPEKEPGSQFTAGRGQGRGRSVTAVMQDQHALQN